MTAHTSNNFDPSLPHCQWWLAITSPQISYNRGDYDYDLPTLKRDLDDPVEWGKNFIDWWGIDTRREWHEMIHRLAMAEVHGDVWAGEFGRRACMSANEWQQRIDRVQNPVAKAEMSYLDAAYRHVGVAGFKGWDFCRGSFLTRAGFCAGKVTQEEFAFLLNYFSRQIQAHFSSWEQYTQSFVFGRNYWEYMNDQDEDSDNISYLLNNGFYVGFSSFYQCLEEDTDCPIPALDWNVELPNIRQPESLRAILSDEEGEANA
ncbi:DUF1266 domain-containing protein [Grimontia marina]|uniref:DUF1266 domain-containing protein n=1 Tax=Grimontia marina TaxID=646534 RepID=A0A128FBZ4_9GAMM|nr:DUF1266 domain-containing protein [Grimontia marina]CZF84319.1 hypothetical protein GMA8713_03056 [Grimontia marina]